MNTQLSMGALKALSIDQLALRHEELENRYSAMVRYASKLQEERQFTSQLAMEGDQILMGTELTRLFYNETEKSQRLTVAMEEVSTTMWGIIAAGIAALVALIYKLIKWMSGDGAHSGFKSGTAMSAEEVQKFDHMVKEIEKASAPATHSQPIAQAAQTLLLEYSGKAQAQEVVRQETAAAQRKISATQHVPHLEPMTKLIFFETKYPEYISQMLGTFNDFQRAAGPVLFYMEEFIQDVEKVDADDGQQWPDEKVKEYIAGPAKKLEDLYAPVRGHLDKLRGQAKQVDELVNNAISGSGTINFGNVLQRWFKLMSDPLHRAYARDREEAIKIATQENTRLQRSQAELDQRTRHVRRLPGKELVSSDSFVTDAMQKPVTMSRHIFGTVTLMERTVGKYQHHLVGSAKTIASILGQAVDRAKDASEEEKAAVRHVVKMLNHFHSNPFQEVAAQ